MPGLDDKGGALWAAWVGAAITSLGFGFVFIMMSITYLAAGACVLAMRDRAGVAH